MWIVYLQMILLISKYCKRETTDNKVPSLCSLLYYWRSFIS